MSKPIPTLCDNISTPEITTQTVNLFLKRKIVSFSELFEKWLKKRKYCAEKNAFPVVVARSSCIKIVLAIKQINVSGKLCEVDGKEPKR
jgi:hypothetical protein